jgi:putative phosphoesterase
MYIGLVSDTHGVFSEEFRKFMEPVDEVWHAGDFGDLETLSAVAHFKPMRGVYGNCDGTPIRQRVPYTQVFECEGMKVLMMHIGGYPGKYAPGVKAMLLQEQPNLMISGHSHILKVIPDRMLNLLHINPGAAGKQGWHVVRTLVILTIDEGTIKDCEIIELGNR